MEMAPRLSGVAREFANGFVAKYLNQWLSINAFGVVAILEQQLIDTLVASRL
jgi:hypothetical protein